MEIENTRQIFISHASYEWNRLVQDPFHRLEYETTFDFLKKNLPEKGLILDAGGGPGRYTIELARMGYDVILLDLVSDNLELAKEQIKKAKVNKNVKEIIEGSITDLSRFSSDSFDAVLCLGGPLSHVHTEPLRQKAVSEMVRVAKSGAPIFTSVMSKYGVLLATPEGWPQAVSDKENFDSIVLTGDDYRWMGSGYCHFFTSEELRQLFSKEKVEVVQLVGLEGLNTDNQTTNIFAEKYPDAWKNWVEIHMAICTEPFVVDASGHMMIIVIKK